MTKLRADIYAWIPQPDVPNPLFAAAKLNERLAKAIGPGACGSRFGGDDFQYPPRSPAEWGAQKTYRAMQSVEIAFDQFGAAPVMISDSGVQTGTTTVLTDERRRQGTVCHSMKASVMKSPAATVAWSGSDQWYELAFAGAAQDPVPADVARHMAGDRASRAAAWFVPNLSWDVCLRFQKNHELPLMTQARYLMSSSFSLDSSKNLSSQDNRSFPAENFLHGTITITQFPSYVLYLTSYGADGVPQSQIAYFADASARILALGRILVAQTDILRPLSW